MENDEWENVNGVKSYFSSKPDISHISESVWVIILLPKSYFESDTRLRPVYRKRLIPNEYEW